MTLTSHVTVSYLHMGWLRLVGSLKLKVSSEEKPYKRDDILHKRPMIATHQRVMTSTSHVTVSYLHMGWLRLVGSLKLKVFFAKGPYKRDDILQKRPMILRSPLIMATP